MTSKLDHGLDIASYDFGATNHHTFVVTAIPTESEGPNTPMLTALDSARLQFGQDFVSGDARAFVVRAGTDKLYVENRKAFHELLRTAFTPGGLIEWFYFRVGHDTALLDMSDAPRRQPERLFPTEETAPVEEGAELAKHFLANESPPLSLLLAYLRKRTPAPVDEAFTMNRVLPTEPIYDDRLELAARVYNRGVCLPKPLDGLYTTLGEILACSDWRDRLLRKTTLPGEESVLNANERKNRAEVALRSCDAQRTALILLAAKLSANAGYDVRARLEVKKHNPMTNTGRHDWLDLGHAQVQIKVPSPIGPRLLRWTFYVRSQQVLIAVENLLRPLEGKLSAGMQENETTNDELLSFLNQETP